MNILVAIKEELFIEFSKHFIDDIHAWHSREPRKFKISDFTRSMYGLHFYDSVLVIEKREMTPPFDSKTGHESVKQYKFPITNKFSCG